MRGPPSYDPSLGAPQRTTALPSVGGALAQKKNYSTPPEGWDALAAALRQPKPLTNAGWPEVANAKNATQHLAEIASLAAVARHDEAYLSIITKSGKVFIGDWHSVPEGWITLQFMLKELPVKKIYLESNGIGAVLQNNACMQWIRNNPHATAVETSQKMVELCLSQPPLGVHHFLLAWTSESGRLHGLSPEAAADVYRRRIEVECSVARQIIDKNIVVEGMFKDGDNPTDPYDRSLSHDAWRSFNDTSTGLSAFLVGEAHVVNGSPVEPALFNLLEKSDGVLARTPYSYARSSELRPYGRDPFRDARAVSQGTWSSATYVPGVSADHGDAPIKHPVLFTLYTADIPRTEVVVPNTATATATTTTTTTDTTVTMTTTPTAATTTGSMTRPPDAPANS